MVTAVLCGFVDWCWGGCALRVGGAVGEGYELGEGVGTVGAAEEGGVTDLASLGCARYWTGGGATGREEW